MKHKTLRLITLNSLWILSLVYIVLGISTYIDYHSPTNYHHESWIVDKVERCNNEVTSPYCVADISHDSNHRNAINLNFIVEEGSNVYRNCYIQEGQQHCLDGFSLSVPNKFKTPVSEIDDEYIKRE